MPQLLGNLWQSVVHCHVASVERHEYAGSHEPNFVDLARSRLRHALSTYAERYMFTQSCYFCKQDTGRLQNACTCYPATSFALADQQLGTR